MVAWWDDLRRPRPDPGTGRRCWSPASNDELAGIDQAKLVADRDAVLNALLAAKRQTDLP